MSLNYITKLNTEHKNLSRETNFWNNYLVNYVLGDDFYSRFTP